MEFSADNDNFSETRLSPEQESAFEVFKKRAGFLYGSLTTEPAVVSGATLKTLSSALKSDQGKLLALLDQKMHPRYASNIYELSRQINLLLKKQFPDGGVVLLSEGNE